MTTGQDTIVKTRTVKDALLQDVNDDMAELFVSRSEVIAARTSAVTAETHASLDARLEAIEASVSASAGDGGTIVSLNDATPGVLNGKITAGNGITLVERNDGGNEALEVQTTFASQAEAIAGTNAVKTISPSTLTDVLVSHFLI